MEGHLGRNRHTSDCDSRCDAGVHDVAVGNRSESRLSLPQSSAPTCDLTRGGEGLQRFDNRTEAFRTKHRSSQSNPLLNPAFGSCDRERDEAPGRHEHRHPSRAVPPGTNAHLVLAGADRERHRATVTDPANGHPVEHDPPRHQSAGPALRAPDGNRGVCGNGHARPVPTAQGVHSLIQLHVFLRKPSAATRP